jgi:hypothetical protein
MKPWKLGLAFLAMFVAGAIVGGLTTMHFFRPPFGRSESADEISRHVMSELRGRLQLSDSQVSEIDPIIRHNVEELLAFHRELAARVQASLDGTDRQIEGRLDPSQKAKFEKFRAQRPRLPAAP